MERRVIAIHGVVQGVGFRPFVYGLAQRLRMRVWKALMDLYYPNSSWLCVRRDVFDRLNRYKIRQGRPTWEETLEKLLPVAEA